MSDVEATHFCGVCDRSVDMLSLCFRACTDEDIEHRRLPGRGTHGVRLRQGRSSGWGLCPVFEPPTFLFFSVAGVWGRVVARPKGEHLLPSGITLRRSAEIFKVGEASQSRFVLSLCCWTLARCGSMCLRFGMLQVCEDEGHCAQWNATRRAIERCSAAPPLSRFQWRPWMAGASSSGHLRAEDN